MRSLSLLPVALFALVVLAVPGCGQQNGQVCEVDTDCASGLQCLCRVGMASRGLCLTAGASCAVTTDASGNDAATTPTDAGQDAGSDAGGSDAGGTDAGGTDAGGSDAGGSDAGSDAGDVADAG